MLQHLRDLTASLRDVKNYVNEVFTRTYNIEQKIGQEEEEGEPRPHRTSPASRTTCRGIILTLTPRHKLMVHLQRRNTERGAADKVGPAVAAGRAAAPELPADDRLPKLPVDDNIHRDHCHPERGDHRLRVHEVSSPAFLEVPSP